MQKIIVKMENVKRKTYDLQREEMMKQSLVFLRLKNEK